MNPQRETVLNDTRAIELGFGRSLLAGMRLPTFCQGVQKGLFPSTNTVRSTATTADSRYPHSFIAGKTFSSWMGLCPDNDITGGKVVWTGTRKVKNRVAVTLRMAAQSLQKSESARGEFYRRMRTKLGAPKAITAAAHKLARIIYHMLKTREPYDEGVFAEAEIKHRQRR